LGSTIRVISLRKLYTIKALALNPMYSQALSPRSEEVPFGATNEIFYLKGILVFSDSGMRRGF